jgi:hypothetical protein
VVAVVDDECERRAQRPPVTKAREYLHAILLDLLARAAPVPLLSPLQVCVDRLAIED